MGRWAQSRRRGKVPPAAPNLPAPPAVTATVDGTTINWASHSVSNVGGFVDAYQSNSSLWEEAILYNHEPWVASGSLVENDPGYYWFIETGNGVDYAGDSERSGPFQVV